MELRADQKKKTAKHVLYFRFFKVTMFVSLTTRIVNILNIKKACVCVRLSV